MNTLLLFSTLLMGTFLIIPARCVQKKAGCSIIPEEVELDDEWLDQQRAHGWFVPLGSKLVGATDLSSDPPKLNSSLKTHRCWSAQVKSPLGAMPVPMECRNDNSNKQSCALKTDETPLHHYIRYFGEFTATLTDNETFMVIFGCLEGRINYWVAATVERTIDDATRDLILDHIEMMGFSRKNLKSDKDLLSIDRARITQCRKGNQKVNGVSEDLRDNKPNPKVGKKAKENPESDGAGR